MDERKHCATCRCEGRTIPAGCVCDPRAWIIQPIPPVCNRFEGLTSDCDICDHDYQCHTEGANDD
jgi:hypothetical protein